MRLEVHIVFEQGVADKTIVFLPFGRRWNVWIVFNVDMILWHCCELIFFIAEIKLEIENNGHRGEMNVLNIQGRIECVCLLLL